ncbi:prepilin peptidase [Candidatus Woesearchaeota archaeon]|nr:prepilin peptidase [Candidatus Woesearchaeota archaeon]
MRLSTAFLVLLFASITDIKTREVPDWLSYGAIIFGSLLRVGWSFYDLSWQPLIEGIIGFGIFFAIACVFYYLGQWGGGDAKVLMALGVFFGFQTNVDAIIISFFVNLVFVGAIYSILIVGALALHAYSKVVYQIKKMYKNSYGQIVLGLRTGLILSLAILSIALFIPKDIRLIALLLIIFSWLFFYLAVVIRAVEYGVMRKKISPELLTEGDWVVKDIIVSGKRICGPKDLGVSKEQIKELIKLKKKGKIKNVLMKTGIPFIPSFFLAYLVTLFYGNILVELLKFILRQPF